MYVYFWVPATYDNASDTSIEKAKKIEKILSDVKRGTRQELYLLLHLNTNLDIQIAAYTPEGYRFETSCEYINHYPNGMFVYRIPDGLENIDRTLIRKQVYHHFKSFFHEHIFHNPNDDAILGDAYLSEKHDDLQGAMEWYLDTYRKKYKALRDFLYQFPKKRIVDNFYQDSDIQMAIKRIGIIQKVTRQGYGEFLFALYLSKDYYRRYKNHSYLDLFTTEKGYLDVIEQDIDNAKENIQIAYATLANNKQTFVAWLIFFLSLLFTIILSI